MQMDEAAKICRVIQSAYPTFYRDNNKQDKEMMINLWMNVLEGYTYEQANAGLKMYLRNDKKGFPPSPGQVIDEIEKLVAPAEETMTEAQAWAYAYNAIRNSAYNSAEMFNSLPPVIQRAVGRPEVLQAWSQLPEDELSVTESNFMRSFRASVQREKEQRMIPQSVKKLMGTMMISLEEKDERNQDDQDG